MQTDFKRIVLMIIFGFSVMILWTKWTAYNAPRQTPVAAQSGAAAGQANLPSPMASGTAANSNAATPASQSGGIAANRAAYAQAPKVVVTTPTMKVTVSARGGDIIGVELLKHWKDNKKEQHYQLLQDEGDHFYVARSGLIGNGLPNHTTLFDIKPVVREGNTQVLRLAATGPDGATVTKVLTFTDESYKVDVGYEINNPGSKPVDASAYFELVRDDKPLEHKTGLFGAGSTFTGPAVYTEEGRFQKVDFKKIAEGKADYQKTAKDGWVAMVQHFFVAAYLPVAGTPHEFFMRKVDDAGELFGAGVKFKVDAAAGKSVKFTVPMYVGPQEQKNLEAVAPNFNLVVDYGWTTIIAQPLFWGLAKIHGILGNWGWSILLVTFLIKLVFFPLSAASYKSMAKMKEVMPRIKALQERYANDKVKQQQAMMELYKTEKVNPAGGCLPIAVQMPVFMALYYVLQSVVEMRQAPWLGWIQDLSSPDPYYILPIIMGVTMLVQTKLNPTPADPVQAKVMYLMPIFFTAMFLFFPSGLVLYWVLNNFLSILQQWYITRKYTNVSAKAAN
jgi:YidC/Oxa1 family membrane protein insertase